MSREIFIDSGPTSVDTKTLVGAASTCSRASETLNAVSVRVSQAVWAAQLAPTSGPFGEFGGYVMGGVVGMPPVQYTQALNSAMNATGVVADLAGQLERLRDSLALAADVYDRAERVAMGVLSDSTGAHGWMTEAGMDWVGRNVSPMISGVDWSFRVGKAYLWSLPYRLAGDQSGFERALAALVIDRIALTRTADHPVECSSALVSQLYPWLESSIGEYRADLVMQPSIGTGHALGTLPTLGAEQAVGAGAVFGAGGWTGQALRWSRSDYRYGLEGFDVYKHARVVEPGIGISGEGSAVDGDAKRRIGRGLLGSGELRHAGIGITVGGLISRNFRNRLTHPETRAVLEAIGRTSHVSRPVAVPAVAGGVLTTPAATSAVSTPVATAPRGLSDLAKTTSRTSSPSLVSSFVPSVPAETPQSPADLVARVRELRDNPTGAGVAGEGSTHGEFEIQRHESPGSDRPSWSVIVRGTQQWHPTTPNPKDMQANLALVGGVPADEQAAIMAALELSGAENGDTIELVGHSQGGLVAGAMASNPAFTSRYEIAGVVTAGSPIQGMDIAKSTPVLALEHTDDFVAALDGQPATSSKNHITIYSRGGDSFAHDLSGYVDDAAAAEEVGNADLERWNADRLAAMGITEDAKTTQQRYTITRVKR